ncbi:hypothetical protein EDB85DRAFT_245304 [Lactarius pseudohatsudake]|nr:hypothetical protein EDB85DRAFT_245304 [Lactarius pseudohatsudake]
MKARRAIPLDSEHPISTNTVPVGLFKALANGNGNSNSYRRRGRGTTDPPRCSKQLQLTRNLRASIPPVARQPDVLTLLQGPPVPPRFPPRDEHACSLFSDTSVHPQDISRRLELHGAR